MIQHPPISFRFTEQELEVLEKEQLQNESIHQTASRLLRERLGLINVNNKSNLNKQTLEKWINDIITSRLDAVVCECNNVVYKEVDKVSKRIEKLETKSRSTRKSTTKAINVSEDI